MTRYLTAAVRMACGPLLVLALISCTSRQSTPDTRAVAGTGSAAIPATTASAPAWSFTGSWTMIDGHGASFDLDLVQSGNRLSGRHCAATANATRIDCWMVDGDPDTSKISIEGTVHGDSAEVTFTSAYGETDAGKPVTGRARIVRDGGMIRWATIGEPDGDEYLPTTARLKRAKAGRK